MIIYQNVLNTISQKYKYCKLINVYAQSHSVLKIMEFFAFFRESGAVANREEIRKNPQKHPIKYPKQIPLSIRRNTQAKTPQVNTLPGLGIQNWRKKPRTGWLCVYAKNQLTCSMRIVYNMP